MIDYHVSYKIMLQSNVYLTSIRTCGRAQPIYTKKKTSFGKILEKGKKNITQNKKQ